ncbi:hypothetical protein EJM73_08315 [Clostridium botulinum]|uniref:hypothetical protein n=1 Tax=Clostridium botulinum TaxID=1491 RepID=UPI0013762A20|nr:hypothetical protein [Clostridium botulinum]NCI19903.1 hypothetical protein [Clostridium botulinum]NCI35665.1 hypothetical protein [Clostridium botulinum]NCI71798.1 hypothetical protein [Clostridium botulinum]NDI38714.1 hypothetical protein [Clostridium botulinum]HCL4447070.1 hypothetical protein [Clostridium botulinum]
MEYLLSILMTAVVYLVGDRIAKTTKSTFFDEYFIGIITGILMVFVYTLTITI